MSVLLPLRTDSTPFYAFGVALEGVSYNFTFKWNTRGSLWTFDVADGAGVALVSGRRVVVGLPLLARFKDPRLPPGQLVAFDTTGAGVDPGLADLGTRVTIVYWTAAEVAGV